MRGHQETTRINVSAREIASKNTEAETVMDMVVAEVLEKTRIELAFTTYHYEGGMSGYVVFKPQLTGFPDEPRGVEFTITAGQASLSKKISTSVRKVVRSVVDTIHETLETLDLERS